INRAAEYHQRFEYCEGRSGCHREDDRRFITSKMRPDAKDADRRMESEERSEEGRRMKVMGFRADPTAARYAIVNFDGTIYRLDNANSESRLAYPADIDQASSKVLWLYREIERIFHANSDIAAVAIKTNEYGLTEKAAMRQSSYAEAAVALLSEQR